MAVEWNRHARHAYDNTPPNGNYGGQLWNNQYWCNAGNVKVIPVNFKYTYKDINGNWHEPSFEWLEVQFRLYKRAGANSMYVGSKIVRRYWGQGQVEHTIASVPNGSYSWYTRPYRIKQGGQVKSMNHSVAGGQDWALDAHFHMYHH